MKKKTYKKVDFATALYEQTHNGAVVEYKSVSGDLWFTPTLPLREWHASADVFDGKYLFAIVTEAEPKFRPWKIEEVPLGKIIKAKQGNERQVLTYAYMQNATGALYINSRTPDVFLRHFTMDDGSPCGVEE